MKRKPAVFLDRDGVLNRDIGYPRVIGDISWIDGAAEAVSLCNDAGYFVFVVTNQSGVARGYFDEATVKTLHRDMLAILEKQGAHIDDVLYCPHLKDATVATYRLTCDCRKPAPGMILNLMSLWPVDRDRSFLVGDKQSDLQAAQAVRIHGYLFEGGSLARFIAPLLGLHEINT